MNPLILRRVACVVVILAGLFAMTGCGGVRGVQVKGQLVLNGKPYRPAQTESVQLSITGLEAQGGKPIAASASVSPDGTFTVLGPENTGMPTGKYRITLTCITYDPKRGMGGDKFRGAFAGDRSPLTFDLTADRGEITVDLGTKKVS